ncbi:MAG: LamG domain-containing protein [Candidatus Saccharicenans sp.]|nr:LamG domain-containing protein [Candidatus Saccharicenans sp.]
MKKTLAILGLTLMILVSLRSRPETNNPKNLIAWWKLESVENSRVNEVIGGENDLITGNFKLVNGVADKAIRFDGFTTVITREAAEVPVLNQSFTIEAWVAPAAYPWNWCPLVAQHKEDKAGFYFGLGPRGEVGLGLAVNGRWQMIVSEEKIPLRKWSQIAVSFDREKGARIYINGRFDKITETEGSFLQARDLDLVIGMNYEKMVPSDPMRPQATLPARYSFDGIIDEIKIFGRALDKVTVTQSYQLPGSLAEPDIPLRVMPSGRTGPGRFGAYYTRLNYYEEWEALWRVGDYADVVVEFDDSPIRVVFWRGTRYSPVWVMENGQWMADQSAESFTNEDGCFEHMLDAKCLYSHVRIIENTEARVVVHWRYAPVSVNENTWRRDPKTGWECWVDEYYYIYPDRTAIRKVSWKAGSLEFPRQFQESEVLLPPGQIISEVVEKDFASVADYNGRTKVVSFVEDPGKPPYGPFSWDKFYDYTLQQFNFKSKNRPFICFEPQNKMWIRYENIKSFNAVRGCNHWPVGQARCDGRTTIVADRPSHTIGFPISEPVVHESGGREFWCGLYGMNEMDLKDLVRFGRSCAFAAELIVKDGQVTSTGYDRSERCYKIENLSSEPGPLSFILAGSRKSPIINPAVYIKNWNSTSARVMVDGQELKNCRPSLKRTLDGIDLIIFLPLEKEVRTEIKVIPEP